MRLEIRYLTSFTYDADVSESQNALRARPASDARQRVLSYTLTVDPTVRVASHTDYWGTQVDSFGVVGRHSRLVIVAESVVETTPTSVPPEDTLWPPMPAHNLPEGEYLVPSPHVTWNDEVENFAREATRNASSTFGAAISVQRAVGDWLRYETGSTEIGVSVTDVFRQRSGVCQDYSHLALAAYRSLGIPARYVSGYLYAVDSSRGERPEAEEVTVATHAWVEVLIPGHGWWALDPTNQLAVGERHVKIGHGRDYEDVMPLRGVYHGDAESDGLTVSVHMTRAGLHPYAVQPPPELIQRQQQQ